MSHHVRPSKLLFRFPRPRTPPKTGSKRYTRVLPMCASGTPWRKTTVNSFRFVSYHHDTTRRGPPHYAHTWDAPFFVFMFLPRSDSCNAILRPGCPRAAARYGSTASFIFAYQGQSIFLEVMREMKKPEEFPKTVRQLRHHFDINSGHFPHSFKL